MPVVIIKMTALPEKCLELKQTILALIEPTRKEKGCLRCDVFEDIENENSFCLVEYWESRKDLDDHQRSDRFAVLMGTRSLLSTEPEIMINEVSP
jgi:quinol monooxygenase YgiN